MVKLTDLWNFKISEPRYKEIIYKKHEPETYKIQISECIFLQIVLINSEMKTPMRKLNSYVLGWGKGYFIGKS